MKPVILLGAAAIFSAGAMSGYKVTADHYTAAAAKAQKEAAEAYQARTVELNQVSAELEQAKNDRKTVYRTIVRNVETYIDRPVYQRECLDDDGLRDANTALAGRAGTGQPPAAVPAAPAAGR